MTPEGKIQAYLVKRVHETGGAYRRLQWIGRNGAPDVIAWWPDGSVAFIEVKALGEKPTKQQLYEHRQMIETGLDVYVVDSKETIESMLKELNKCPQSTS